MRGPAARGAVRHGRRPDRHRITEAARTARETVPGIDAEDLAALGRPATRTAAHPHTLTGGDPASLAGSPPV
uniref:hypothetical protein n=1 Tax=Streptomyces puniciscabiei TaxID=164348 RepID=UPI0006EB31E6